MMSDPKDVRSSLKAEQEQEQKPRESSNNSQMMNNKLSSDEASSEKAGHASESNMPPSIEDDDAIFESPRSTVRDAMDLFNQFRYRCGSIVNNEHVQLVVVMMIAINAVMMGVATFDFVTENPDVSNAFDTCDEVFLVIFTVELGLQAIFHGWRLLLDGWLVFDLLVIVMSWTFAEVQIIRAFRIFRALRLITRIAVMKNLVLALFGVMPRMCAIGILLFLVSYIFAVMFTQLFKDMYAEGQTTEDYFSRMDATFFTLFQIMTMDSWADIAREVMVVYSWAWLPFICFVIITGFIVVNLIIAVICDAISALNDDEKAKLEGAYESSNRGMEGMEEDEDGNLVPVHEESTASPLPEADVQEQLDSLEAQVEELTRVQVQTLYTLEYLARQLQRARNAAVEEKAAAEANS